MSVPFPHGNTHMLVQWDEGRCVDAHPESTATSSPCSSRQVTLPPSLTGVARAKLESRSHTSPQDVINLPSQRLFLVAFGSHAWDFLSLFTGCLSCGMELWAVVPAGRAGMGADARERREKGEADLCASP